MRVALVTPVYPPYKGGIGSIAARDARLLQEHGAEVTVFTPKYMEGEEEAGVVRLKPLQKYGNAAITPSLLWRMKGVDLVHIHYPCYGLDIFAVLAAFLRRKPYVVTYHMKAYANDWRNTFFTLHRFLLEPFVLRFAKAVFVSTLDYAAAVHLRHHNLIEMPFGVDTDLFYPEKDEAFREQLGIAPGTFCILFVGGLDKAHYFKGVDVLLRAVAYLERSTPYRLLIVGDGEERPTFEKMARDLGVGDNVTFLGGIGRKDLVSAYKAANVHVLPSLDQGEAFGLVTLEAASSGVPSIVSNLPGMRMLVDPGVTGLRFPAGDARSLAKALQAMALNRPNCEKMGQAARRMAVRQYNEGKVAERMLKAYKECSL